ncbi:MAG: sensor histidine kinase [Bacteroidales bacterium]
MRRHRPFEKKYENKALVITTVIAITLITPFVFDEYESDLLSKKMLIGFFGSLCTTLIMWLGVKSIVIYLWNKFPWETYPFKHLVLEVLSILFYTSLVILIYYVINLFHSIDSFDENIKLSIFFTLTITFFITSIYEGYFFFLNWKETKILSERLAKENIQSQYETLKSQINPHFLFNNLNTLSALIEENPKVAVEYVRQTADFYRNILNLKDKEIITLGEEFELIRTFFKLQYNRYGDNLRLNIDVDSSLYSSYVAPLSLQMLLENAIKHNIISKDKPLVVTISATENYIRVSNNLQKRDLDQPTSGFGLKNITDRYSYLSSRSVEISENDLYFTVSIPILTM